MRKIKKIEKKTNESSDKSYKQYLFMLAFIVVCIAAFIAVISIKPHKKTEIVEFSSESGKLTDKKNGISYVMCSRSLSARNKGEPYGTTEGIDLYRIYTVNGDKVDTDDYLADEDGFIFRNEKLSDISVADFKAIGGYFYYKGTATGGELYPKKEYLSNDDPGDIPDDTELTNKIIDTIVNGKPTFNSDYIVDDDTYEIKFCSAEFPQFYYSILVCRDENGRAYLYHSADNAYYVCPDELAVRVWGKD